MGFFDLFTKSEKAQARREEKERLREETRAKEQAEAFAGMEWPVPPRMNPVNVAGASGEEKEDPVLPDRKDEIGAMLFAPHINAEPLKFLPLEELLFLTDAHEKFHREKALDNYEENRKVLRSELLRRIRAAESLFLLNDLSTGYPFIDHGYVNVYLDKEKAERAVKAFAAQYRNLSVKRFLNNVEETGLEKRQDLFDYLYYLGMEHILINNGGYRATIVRSEIAAPPGLTGEGKVAAQPALCFAMCDFLGEARWNVKYEKRAEVLRQKEARMLNLIKKATYIVPIQHEGPAEVVGTNRLRFNSETKIRFFILQDKNEKTFLPVFTDVQEYLKKFNTAEWEGAAFTFDQVKSFMDGRDGLVINPFGENVMLLKERIMEG